MKFLRLLLRRKFFTGVLVGASAASMLLAYQNCAPANFRRLDNSKVGGQGIDPGATPPPPTCNGFWANHVSEVTLPNGQPTVSVGLRGGLGQAVGPMSWLITKTGMTPITKLGTEVSVSLGAGTYTVKAQSGNNYCTDTFQLKVLNSDQCVNPQVASGIDLELVGDPNALYVNENVNFKINNFSQLQQVKVKWTDASSPEDVVSSPFSHPYPQIGQYNVTVTAKDKDIAACAFSVSRSITIKVRDAQCTAVTQALNVTPPSSTSGSATSLVFTVNNFAQLKNVTVSVDCGSGAISGTGTYTQNPITCSYPVNNTDTPIHRTVTVTAKSKSNPDGNPSCEIPLTYAFNYDQTKPPGCTKQLTETQFRQRITASAGPNIFTTTPVKFNANLTDELFSSFTWNLGNGMTGSTVAALNAKPPVTYANYANSSVSATFTGTGPATCGETYTHTIPFNITIQKQFVDFVVSASTNTPPVKLFFIVDNSVTMEDEQTALSNAFDQVFADSNVNNLKKFDTTLYVFNTAQYNTKKGFDPASDTLIRQVSPGTPEHVSSVISYNLLYGLTTSTVGSSGDYYYYQNARKFCDWGAWNCSNNVGNIVGDVIGFRNTSADYNFFNFDIAPVANFQKSNADGSGHPVPQLYSSISANPSQSQVDAFVADFKERVKYLNPKLYNQNQFDRISKHESGMCAIARILDAGLVGYEDQASFVIVSDENENSINGANCMKTTGFQSMDYGACYPYGTSFSWTTGAYCNIYIPTFGYKTYYYDEWYVREPLCSRTNDRGDCVEWARYRDIMCDGSGQQTCESVLASSSCTSLPSGVECVKQSTSKSGTTYDYDVSDGIPAGYTWGGYGNIERADAPDCYAAYYSQFPQCRFSDAGCTFSKGYHETTIQIPVANLTCDSQCPAAYSSICGTGKIWEYIQNNGGDCSGGYTVLLTDPSFAKPSGPFPTGTPMAQRCSQYSGYQWNTSQTSNQDVTTYLTGNTTGSTNNLPLKPLNTFIKDAIVDRTARGLKPTFTSITYTTSNPPPLSDDGASIGTDYINLVGDVGFNSMAFPITRVGGVIDPNGFRHPLQVMTDYITLLTKAVFEMTLGSGQTVRAVSVKQGANPSKPIKTDSWVVSGSTLRVGIQEGDKLKVNYTDGSTAFLNAGDIVTVEYW